MHESFLYYVWQLQYFNKNALKTTDGERLEIFNPGTLNTNSGPDFLNSKIRIGNIDWAGNVEIHTKASDWHQHQHNTDPAYDNVILHVVWKNDKPVKRADQTILPVLELNSLVDEGLIEGYKKLVNSPSSIPCEKSIHQVEEIIRLSMLDKALMQRLESKVGQVLLLLKQHQNDWEAITYQLIGRNFGFKVNSEPFFQLVQAVPRKLLLKHADSLIQIEALLFGQAGCLEYSVKDDHLQLLQREYAVLLKKYSLEGTQINVAAWRFLRLRPANFPTLRIAQFAALFNQRKNLFSQILEITTRQQFINLFDVRTSEYWNHHYRFARKTTQSLSGMGDDSIVNLIINTVVPLLVAYGRYQDEQQYIDRAVSLLQEIPAENNKIVRAWKEIGISARSAFDSQALLELNNNFCMKRKCLVCNIGNSLLRPMTKV